MWRVPEAANRHPAVLGGYPSPFATFGAAPLPLPVSESFSYRRNWLASQARNADTLHPRTERVGQAASGSLSFARRGRCQLEEETP